jgi:transposase
VSEPTVSAASILADTIVRTIKLGVTITDAAVHGETTVVWCDVVDRTPSRCPDCGTTGIYRDSIERRLSNLPVTGHLLQLRVRVARYRCPTTSCERAIFTHDTSGLARPGASTTRRCARFVLRRLVVDRATITAVARELGRSWDTINSIAVQAITELLDAHPTRLDNVQVLGVDEHRWAHTRHAAGDGFVTVIVDLTAVVAQTGRARLLDLVEGRSAAAFAG